MGVPLYIPRRAYTRVIPLFPLFNGIPGLYRGCPVSVIYLKPNIKQGPGPCSRTLISEREKERIPGFRRREEEEERDPGCPLRGCQNED